MSEVNLGELISKIAHELRSPLTSVKGFSSMLLTRWDRFTDEQRYQFVETIAADAERMGRIVTEVLDLARMEAGRIELHKTIVEVRPLIEAAAARSAELPGADRVVVEVEDGLTAWADAERLESVVANLIENAIKFSDEGAVTIAGRDVDSNTVISVSDEGVGITPELLPHVFSGPAQTGGRATPTGSGLGLYLSRGLIELHDGRIDADSAPGKGSVFTVTLPAPSADPGDSAGE
jgi:signal transduction histidine kinase